MPKVDQEREKRLAEALRQNLKRRKAQARDELAKSRVLEADGSPEGSS